MKAHRPPGQGHRGQRTNACRVPDELDRRRHDEGEDEDRDGRPRRWSHRPRACERKRAQRRYVHQVHRVRSRQRAEGGDDEQREGEGVMASSLPAHHSRDQQEQADGQRQEDRARLHARAISIGQ